MGQSGFEKSHGSFTIKVFQTFYWSTCGSSSSLTLCRPTSRDQAEATLCLSLLRVVTCDVWRAVNKLRGAKDEMTASFGFFTDKTF